MITIKDLHKKYGDNIVFDGLDLQLDDGIYALSAPSGKGKTTLLRIIAGLEKPDSGTVDVSGEISVDFQDSRLFEWMTILQNVSPASKALYGKASQILSSLGLDGNEDMYPNQLSGGMQRRVALARALCVPYDILLLDEPFTGLDEENINKAFRTVKESGKGKTVIIATHDAAVASMCDAKIEL